MRTFARWSLAAILVICLCGVSNATAPDFDYKTFRSLTALVPQMKDPRPIGGMSEAGFELWTQGRMQLTNPDQYRAEADFDGNGKMDVALPFRAKKNFIS